MQSSTPGAATSRKPKNIKQHNQKLVLSLLRGEDTLSVTEIAERTNLSKTTVSKLFVDFHQKELVLSAGKGSSTDEGGKKPELFRLNPDYRYVVNVNLFNPQLVECCITDLQGSIREIQRHPLPPSMVYEDCVELIAEVIKDIIATFGVNFGLISGISLACEGIVDAFSGTIVHSMHHSWPRLRPIKDDLLALLPFQTEVFVDNVCRFGGYAELLFPENQIYSNIITIWSDSYLGGCVISNRQMVRGLGGLVGEFGHVIIDPRSEYQCACGGRGCFESLAAKETVLAKAKTLLEQKKTPSVLQPEGLMMQQLFAAADDGDALARMVLDDVVDSYAIFIHNLAGVRNPQKIILQGLYANAGAYFLESLRQKVRSFPFCKIHKNIEIEYSGYANDINEQYFMKGAGKYLLDCFFKSNA